MEPAEIIQQYDALKLSNANEAETRLKVINHIIYDVLGWTHADVSVEERVSEDKTTTWADYVLRTGMTAIVIEAKKAGAMFDDAPNVRRTQLRGKIMAGELGEAIVQARDYARKLGIPFAAVTNGNAWIVFPATRVDQVSFQNSSAIIFDSLKSALEADYSEFVDLLSRTAAIDGNLENELLGRIENQIEDRRLNRFFTKNFSRITRHSLFPHIESAVVTAFSDDIINNAPDLLEKCYVQTPERIRFDNRIKLHIAKRDSVTNRTPIRALKEQTNPVSELISAASERARPVAVLLLGSVGAGKTTFLEHTRKVAAKDLFAPKATSYPHWLKIDFRDYSTDINPLNFILEDLKRKIGEDEFLRDYERCVKPAYREEVENLLSGPLFLLANDEEERTKRVTNLLMSDYEKTEPYVEKILRYTAEHAPVFLVIDNIDQFDDERDQSRIFASAMALAQRLRLNLICSIREATYIRHRSTPLFDAFDFDAISIDPPNVQAVLSKRFFVARQLLEGKSASFTAENGAEMHISSLSKVIDLVQSSVLGTQLGNLIEVMATGDIRLALRMTREFLQSGWTASGKAYRLFESQGFYVMPQHEALRAIMLGNHQVYAEEFSVLGNPFDSRLAKTEAQALRLYVLTAIVQLSSERAFRYLEGLEIKKALRTIGFGDQITQKVLDDLCRLRFMHTTSHGKATLESNFIVSRLGGYIVRQFIADMMFLENVMMDTFIADKSTWDEIYRLTNDIYTNRDTVKRIAIRRDRATKFYDYMTEIYAPLRDESIRRGLAKEWCTNPLVDLRSRFDTNLQRVARSAERHYGPEADGRA